MMPENKALGHYTGERYEEALDIVEIAKRVRRDIRAAKLPGRYRVRISRYSMGQSLTIDAAVPFDARHGDVERENRERAQGLPCPWMTREGHELYEALERIGNAYNYDRSDTMTDYFDSNYHLHVNVTREGA